MSLNSDEIFFRIVHDAFPAAFLAGAGVLLGSYDIDTLPATEQRVSTAPTAPVAQPSGTALTEH